MAVDEPGARGVVLVLAQDLSNGKAPALNPEKGNRRRGW
jgi:hypothetical protein